MKKTDCVSEYKGVFMKNKLFSVILICVLAAVMTLAACAEETYTFTLSDGETFKEENEFWYADLTAAHISGMADENLKTIITV